MRRRFRSKSWCMRLRPRRRCSTIGGDRARRRGRGGSWSCRISSAAFICAPTRRSKRRGSRRRPGPTTNRERRSGSESRIRNCCRCWRMRWNGSESRRLIPKVGRAVTTGFIPCWPRWRLWWRNRLLKRWPGCCAARMSGRGWGGGPAGGRDFLRPNFWRNSISWRRGTCLRRSTRPGCTRSIIRRSRRLWRMFFRHGPLMRPGRWRSRPRCGWRNSRRSGGPWRRAARCSSGWPRRGSWRWQSWPAK